jgi:hypothetical protein
LPEIPVILHHRQPGNTAWVAGAADFKRAFMEVIENSTEFTQATGKIPISSLPDWETFTNRNSEPEEPPG